MLEYDETWFEQRCLWQLGMGLVVQNRYRMHADGNPIDAHFIRKAGNGSYVRISWVFDDNRGDDGITLKVEDFARVTVEGLLGLGISISNANAETAELRTQIQQRKQALDAEAKRILL